MKKKAEYNVWNAFIKFPDVAICRACGKELVHKKSYGTGSLRAHIRSKHRTEHIKLLKTRNYIVRRPENNEHFFSPLSHAKQKRIEQKLCVFFAANNIALNCVRTATFHDFCRELNNKFSPPTPHNVRNTMLPEMKRSLELEIKELISNKKLSLQLDEFSKPRSSLSILAIIATCFISEERRHFLLRVVPKGLNRWTTEHLTELVNETLMSYEIEPRQVQAVITDGAKNMEKLRSNFHNSISIHCVLHVLHLIVSKSLQLLADQEQILDDDGNIRYVSDLCFTKVLKKIKDFLHMTSSSVSMKNDIRRMAKELMEPVKIPKRYIRSRWNSLYGTLKDVVQLEKTLKRIMADVGMATFSSQEMSILKEVLEILEVFSEYSSYSSHSRSVLTNGLIASSILSYNIIKKSAQVQSISAKKLCQLLLSHTSEYFKSHLIPDVHQMALFLDPRFVNSNLVTFPMDTWHTVKEKLLMKLPSEIVGTPKSTSLLTFNFLDSSTKEKEVESYLLLASRCHLNWNADVLSWWKENGDKFPRLNSLAMEYLTAPPSSIETERLFSTFSDLLRNDKRVRLSPELCGNLMFIKYYSKHLDKDGNPLTSKTLREPINIEDGVAGIAIEESDDDDDEYDIDDEEYDIDDDKM